MIFLTVTCCINTCVCALCVCVLCVCVCVCVRVQDRHPKPFKAGNEQAEDCCNDVTQMSRVQILQAENESADQGLVPPVTPSALPTPSLYPAWDTIRGYLAAGNMCMYVSACVRII